MSKEKGSLAKGKARPGKLELDNDLKAFDPLGTNGIGSNQAPPSPGFGSLANRNNNNNTAPKPEGKSQGVRGKPTPLKVEEPTNLASPRATGNNNSNNPLSPRRMSASPLTPKKKCAHAGCLSERFARGYCAAHLTSGFSASTPTSKIRNTYNLWSKSAISDDTTSQRVWKFADRDYSHTIILNEDLYTGEREITVNKKLAFKGFPDLGFWAIDIAIGQSFEKGTNCRIEVYPTMKGYDYELFIEDVKFDAAHANFLSNLSSVQLMQRMSNLDPIQEKEKQKKEKDYIEKNWQAVDEEDKTSMGYTKTRLTWKFTIQGKHHEVTLEHGHFGGKKKIWLDGNVIFEKKPGLLSAKHKSFRHSFPVQNIVCEVLVSKNKGESSKDEEEDSSSGSDASKRPFIYELLVDGVPFTECTRTALDHAGGDIAIDKLNISNHYKPSSVAEEEEDDKVAQIAGGVGATSPDRAGRQNRAESIVTNGRRKSIFGSMSAEEVAEAGALMKDKHADYRDQAAEEEEGWAKF